MATNHLQCRQCGTCCQGNGAVRLTDHDIDSLAQYLAMDPVDFVNQYTQLTSDRRALALLDQPGQRCVFLNRENLCQVYPARPSQCRRFPQHWRYREAHRECPALSGQGVETGHA